MPISQASRPVPTAAAAIAAQPDQPKRAVRIAEP